MERRSFVSSLFSLLGFGVAKTQASDPGVQTVTITPSSAVVKVGNLEIVSSDGTGKNTSLKIDGKEIAARRFTLSCDGVSFIWLATVEFYPGLPLPAETP